MRFSAALRFGAESSQTSSDQTVRPIIRVENLGKQYRIGERRARVPDATGLADRGGPDAVRAGLRGERARDENTIWC